MLYTRQAAAAEEDINEEELNDNMGVIGTSAQLNNYRYGLFEFRYGSEFAFASSSAVDAGAGRASVSSVGRAVEASVGRSPEVSVGRAIEASVGRAPDNTETEVDLIVINDSQ